MVLESLKAEWVEHHPLLAFLIGLIYTLMSYAIAMFFFKDNPSLPMLFLTTLLIVPSLIKVLQDEEIVERKHGVKHFFTTHKKVIEIYLFLFIGIFVSYLLLGFFSPTAPTTLFNYQFHVLEEQQGLNTELINNFVDSTFHPESRHFIAVIQSDLSVVLLLFALSFFYGAGAIFLIVLNGSIFAAFVTYVFHAMAESVSAWAVLGIFSIHMLPEVSGFLIAAIAGGVMSTAIAKEKFMSMCFRNVMHDALLLLLIACGFIVVGAALEVYVTTQIFSSVL